MGTGIGINNAAVFKLVPHYVPDAVGGTAGTCAPYHAVSGPVHPTTDVSPTGFQPCSWCTKGAPQPCRTQLQKLPLVSREGNLTMFWAHGIGAKGLVYPRRNVNRTRKWFLSRRQSICGVRHGANLPCTHFLIQVKENLTFALKNRAWRRP